MDEKKNLKILLMAVCDDGMRETLEEIGICYIAAYLRKKGIDVLLLQVREENIDYNKIEEFSPDMVGLTIYEKSRNAVYRTSKQLKYLLKDVFITVGGPFSTYCHKEVLTEAFDVDCAIRGEGEITFYELAERYRKGKALNGLKGITYRIGDEIQVNEDRELIPDLNELPWPARDLLLQSESRVAIISTSRGCLANCSFCSNQLSWKKWRGRAEKNVVDEIEFLVREYGITVFNFADASFEDPDFDRLKNIAKEIIKRNLNIAYLADFRAEFHRKASDELMELLIQSGLCGVCIGIEAANAEDLKTYRKVASIEDNVKSTELFQKYKINILPGFITFNPYSSIEGLKKNILFLEKYQFAASMEIVINQYRMYKGGYLQKKLEKDGLLKNSNYRYQELGYDFVDTRIEFLANFARGYVASIHQVIPFAFDRITHQLELFACFVYQLKKRIGAEENEIVNTQFIKFEEKLNSLRKELNEAIATWFKELLNLAENGWEEEEALQISGKYLSIDYVNKMLKSFISNSNRLQMNLLKINRDYQKEFFFVT